MKKRNIFSCLSLLLMLLIGYGCSDPPPQQYQQKQSTSTPTSSNAAKPSTQNQTTTPLAEEVVVSSNLLAKNFVVILDGSGSMADTACNDRRRSKIEAAKQALAEWMKTLPPDANVGFVSFGAAWTILDIAPGSREPFKAAVAKVSPGGNTPLASAFMVAHKMLMKQMKSQLGYGEYNIICLTDGEDNDQRESLNHWVGQVLQEPIRIYTIGFCIGSKHELNQPGKMVYREAGNLEEIRKGLSETVAEAENFDVTEFK